MEQKKLSVCLPVYNVEKYLPKCIESLKNQTYKNIEIIFVDDKSTDNSLQVIEEQTKNMSNVKIIKCEQNQGLFLARIEALKVCTGDYIAFLDSDDYVDNDFYETYMNAIIEKQADVCVCDYMTVDDNYKEIKNPRQFKRKIELTGETCFNFFCSPRTLPTGLAMLWRKLIKRDVYEKAKLDLQKIAQNCGNIVGGEDTIYTIVFMAFAQKIIFEYGPKYYYCKHPNQSVDFSNSNNFVSQVKSHIKSCNITRKFTIVNDLYNRYYDFDCNYLRIIRGQFGARAYQLNCVEEYEALIKENKIDETIQAVSGARELMKK